MGDSKTDLLPRVFEGLAWLTLGLPVEIISFLLCRPKHEYGCVDGYRMMYALFIGMPMLLVLVVCLFCFVGAIVVGLTVFLFKKFSRRTKR
jgi:hypothetical protein